MYTAIFASCVGFGWLGLSYFVEPFFPLGDGKWFVFSIVWFGSAWFLWKWNKDKQRISELEKQVSDLRQSRTTIEDKVSNQVLDDPEVQESYKILAESEKRATIYRNRFNTSRNNFSAAIHSLLLGPRSNRTQNDEDEERDRQE